MEHLLFERAPERVAAAVAAGVTGFVCDWETRGKAERQAGEGLEENHDTPEDVRRVRALTSGTVVCRVNAVWERTGAEVDAAVASGANIVLVPMVRSPAEVESVLRHVAGRAGVGILVETDDAVRHAQTLASYPLELVYVGLNDLRIDRGTHLFAALADGTVDRVRDAFASHRFGFAGLTRADAGAPLPCRLLLAEMARLRCSFAFLRRSFRRDVAGRDLGAELARLRLAWTAALARDAAQIARDRRELVRRIHELQRDAETAAA